MKWRLITALSGLGLLMGFASVAGFSGGREGVAWLVIAAISAFVLSRSVPHAAFRHGFVAGLIGGIPAPLTQVALFPTYLANNPEMATKFQQVPGGMSARGFVLAITPIIGVGSGLVLGVLALAASRLFGSRRRSTAAREGM